LQDYLSTFKEMGASAFGILAQRPEKVQTFMDVHGLELPILIDAGRAIAKRYGVYHALGLDALNTARPSTFLIDREGRVDFMYVGEGQSDRPDPETIVAELRRFN
jgi:peroxiredoxin